MGHEAKLSTPPDEPTITLGADSPFALAPIVPMTQEANVPAKPSRDRNGSRAKTKEAQEAPAVDYSAMLAARQFDLLRPPPKLPPVLTLCGQSVATVGNLVAIQGIMKAGKTALLSGMVAAALDPGAEHLGFVCHSHPEDSGSNIVHFDCEQSVRDHWEVMETACRRAGVTMQPANLRSYYATDVPLVIRKAMFLHALKEAHENGGIRIVVLDGGADLLLDPNDPTESNAAVDELQQLAIRYNGVIAVVIHENLGGQEMGKTRGHYGSQLQRKVETNLRVVKDATNISTIYSEVARHCHISKQEGVCFQYCKESRMHVQVESATAGRADRKHQDNLEDALEGAKAVLRDAPNGMLRYVDYLKGCMEHLPSIKTQDSAKSKMKRHRELGVIKKTADGEFWMLNPNA